MGKYQPKVPKGSVSRYERDLKPGKYVVKEKLRRGGFKHYKHQSLADVWEQLVAAVPGGPWEEDPSQKWATLPPVELVAETSRREYGPGERIGVLPAEVAVPGIGEIITAFGQKWRVVSVTQDSIGVEPYQEGPSQEEQDALAALHLS